MIERPDFLVAYNAVPVPETMRTKDASDEAVIRTTETFFSEVRDSLDLSPRTLGAFFEMSWKTLVPMYEQEVPPEQRIHGTDDMYYSFRRKGYQALASVTYIRDDPNYQIAHFAKYPLLPATEQAIRDLQHLERIEFGLE